MRFDDVGHIHRWQEAGKFPAIHNDIFAAVGNYGQGGVLDLCSSTGLLGRRVADELGFNACAIESNKRSIHIGLDAGVYNSQFPVLAMRVEPETLGRLHDWIIEHNVRTVLMRRCVPELAEILDTSDLAECYAMAGVKVVILEGRAPMSTSKSPFAKVQAEVNAFAPVFGLRASHANVRVLHLVQSLSANNQTVMTPKIPRATGQ